MARSLRFLTALIALSAAGLFACSDGGKKTEPAEYAWGLPERIDGTDPDNSVQEATELAVNGSGSAIAVWMDWNGGIWTNHYRHSTGWGTSEQIETGEGYVSSYTPPRLAIAPNGTAMLVWLEEQPDAIRGSHYMPGNGWGAAEQIDRGFEAYGVTGPDVAMDDSGSAIATWRRTGEESMIVGSRYTPGGGWGPADRIDAGSAGYDYETRVAMNPTGSAIAVWNGDDGAGHRIFANQYTPATGWGTGQAIGDATNSWAEGPGVVMDGDGNGIVVWRQDYYGEDFSSSRITANRYTPDGGWETPGPIEGGKSTYSYLPYISMNVAGTAVVVWTRAAGDPDPGGLLAMRYVPDSGWEPEELLEAYYYAGSDLLPRVAVNPADDALVVWRAYGRTGENVLSSHYTAGDGWDSSVQINLGRWSSGPPQVGIDDSGIGIAVWTESGASDWGVYANRYAEGLGEDQSALWQPICDATCERAYECSILAEETVAECATECVDDLNRMPCEPNQAAADTCVDELESLSCQDLENEYLPYVCGNVCFGGLLCEGRTCDDQNDCTDDSCDVADGSCAYTPVPDGSSCSNGAGTCQAGLCAAEFACTEQGIRDAVALGGGPHSFDCNGSQTVTTVAEIVIDKSVILDGEGQLTVKGNDTHRVFTNHFALQTPDGVDLGVELRRFQVVGGRAESGGGILNTGRLVLLDSTVSGNTAVGFGPRESGGGGIYNERNGHLMLVRTLVSDNIAGEGPEGSGGGIYNRGTLTLSDSSIIGNSATFSGGGLFTERYQDHPEIPLEPVTLTRSTVAGNTVEFDFDGGGGIWSRGPLTLTACTVTGNAGGAAISGDLTTLVNSTVSANTGAGISGQFELFSTTISGNTISGSGTSTNSLIDTTCTGSGLSSQGGNLESPGNTCGLNSPSDQVNVPTDDVGLGTLRNNGGPTFTQVPTGIAVIDEIPVEACVDADGAPLTTDQRAVARPQGSHCDIGAVEVSP